MISRLKRLLRPLRPVLLPIWRRIRPFVERQGPSSQQDIDWLRSDRRWSTLPSLRRWPIRPLAKREFDALAGQFPYYRARGGYMSVACAAAGNLIERHGLTSALELGPHLRSVIVGADVMDLRAQPALQAEGRVIVHDATITPWPIGNHEYDLFVGLQVFEHLKDAQNEAFLEVCRVARHAIISLPIDWEMSDPRNCHHRISHERALSWFHPIMPTRVELGNPGPRKRLVYVFENLDAAPAIRPRTPQPTSSSVVA
jgi:hypothetical protein